MISIYSNCFADTENRDRKYGLSVQVFGFLSPAYHLLLSAQVYGGKIRLYLLKGNIHKPQICPADKNPKLFVGKTVCQQRVGTGNIVFLRAMADIHKIEQYQSTVILANDIPRMEIPVAERVSVPQSVQVWTAEPMQKFLVGNTFRGFMPVKLLLKVRHIPQDTKNAFLIHIGPRFDQQIRSGDLGINDAVPPVRLYEPDVFRRFQRCAVHDLRVPDLPQDRGMRIALSFVYIHDALMTYEQLYHKFDKVIDTLEKELTHEESVQSTEVAAE